MGIALGVVALAVIFTWLVAWFKDRNTSKPEVDYDQAREQLRSEGREDDIKHL